MKVKRLPKHYDSNGWWETTNTTQASATLYGEKRVDTAIVGGGICGLSTANRLAELNPTEEICIIDAQRIGYGASGRNAGFLLNLHSHGPLKDIKTLQQNMKLWAKGLHSLRHKVEKWHIDCNWSDFGRFYGAAGPDGTTHIREMANTLDHLALDYQWLDQNDFKRRIGTEFYSSGLHVPGSALVNPAALMLGISRNLPPNVTLYESNPVVKFEKAGDGYKVITAKGSVIAKRLVLAAGVFLKDFGIAAGRYIPIATYGSLSTPLTKTQLMALGNGQEFGLLGSSQIGSTLRLTSDKRLFIRNTVNFEPAAPVTSSTMARIVETHRAALINRWPQLASLSFEHSWGGAMALTTNNGGVFGQYDKNLYAVLTNDVSPLTRGEAVGGLLAEYMQDIDSDLLSLQLNIPNAAKVPSRPFLDIGIHLNKFYLNQIASKEI